MTDELYEEYDADGDGDAEASVTWNDEGGDSNYYETGTVEVDTDNNGTMDTSYTVSDTDEDGYLDSASGDFDGNGTTDSWNDTDGDTVIDQNEINLT